MLLKNWLALSNQFLHILFCNNYKLQNTDKWPKNGLKVFKKGAVSFLYIRIISALLLWKSSKREVSFLYFLLILFFYFFRKSIEATGLVYWLFFGAYTVIWSTQVKEIVGFSEELSKRLNRSDTVWGQLTRLQARCTLYSCSQLSLKNVSNEYFWKCAKNSQKFENNWK